MEAARQLIDQNAARTAAKAKAKADAAAATAAAKQKRNEDAAKVAEAAALVAVEIEGEDAAIERSVEYMRERGVQVEEIKEDAEAS